MITTIRYDKFIDSINFCYPTTKGLLNHIFTVKKDYKYPSGGIQTVMFPSGLEVHFKDITDFNSKISNYYYVRVDKEEVIKKVKTYQYISNINSLEPFIESVFITGQRLNKKEEEEMLENNDLSLIYCHLIRRERWPKLEEILISQKSQARIAWYALNVIRGKWTEAEPILFDSVNDDSLIYCIRTNTEFPKIEERNLIFFGKYVGVYHREMMKKAWPIYEEYIKKQPYAPTLKMELFYEYLSTLNKQIKKIEVKNEELHFFIKTNVIPCKFKITLKYGVEPQVESIYKGAIAEIRQKISDFVIKGSDICLNFYKEGDRIFCEAYNSITFDEFIKRNGTTI